MWEIPIKDKYSHLRMQQCEIVMISAVTGVFKIFENIYVFIFVQIVTDSLSHNESSRQLPDGVIIF